MQLPNLTPFFRQFDGVLEYIYQLDEVFGALIFIIAIMISLYSFKIYRFTNKSQYMLFSASFYLIAIGYVLRLIFDIAYETERLRKDTFFGTIDIGGEISRMLILGYMLFVMAGYILLLLVAMRTKKRVSLVIFLIALAGVIASRNYFLSFNIIQIIVISTLLVHFDNNFNRTRTFNAGLVWFSFILVLFGHVMQMLIIYSNKFYLLSNMFNIAGFLLLLLNFIMVRRR